MNPYFRGFLAIFFSLTVVVAVLSGQTITGAFTGTITDASGAVIAGAKVTATNERSGVQFTATTTGAGVYNLLFLPVGEYTLVAEIQGFKRAQLGPYRIEVNQTARIDIPMEVGDTTQSVEVTAAAPILQTESTQTGDTLSATKLTSLPLNGRNFVSLTLLVPGSVSPNPSGMNSRFGARPYVNGNREQTNNFMLDGVDVNDSIDNRVGYSPNVDALEEVKVLTGNISSDYGNAGGATVMMTMKSGGNEFRGNLFWFLRNNVLDANGYFRNRSAATATRLGLQRNIFGGTFGGPIIKNKLFFFTDYEGTEQRSSGPANASVAPVAWRTGNLSQFSQTVRDPLTQLPFGNNQVPQARIVNPVAQALFSNQSLYPLPNQVGVGLLGQTNNFGSSSASTLKNHQGDVKIDWRPTDMDNLSARYSLGNYESFGSRAALPTSLTSGQEGPTQSVVLNWNRTFSPSLVNEARVAYSRVVINDVAIDWSGLLGPNGNQTFGIPGGQPISGLSSVAIGGGLTGIGSSGVQSNTADNKFIYYNNLTWQTGKHVLKFGGQFIRFQQNRYYSGNNGVLGLFQYNATYTGLDFADFLLDTLSRKGRGADTGAWGHRSWRSALFFQDDYKVAPNLTLNIGLRWEYMEPLYEVADRQVNVNTFTGELIRPGGQFGRATYNGYPHQYMPRIGFAWTPDILGKKLVVRAGYAYTSFMEGTGANLRTTLNPPFFLETDFTYDPRTPGSITTGFTDVSAANLSLDMPRPPGVPPQLQGRAWDLDLRPQQTQQINFTLEYQLDNATSFSAAYVTQKGTHLVAPVEANQPLPGVGPFSTWAPLNDRRPLIGVLPNLGNIARTESSATMDYHSLQTTARRRLANGLELLASYTFGKTLTDNLGYYGSAFTSSEGAYWQNAYDRRANRGRSFFDIRHNFTLGGAYYLPVGKGQKFGSNMNPIVEAILGGWNTSYTMIARTGVPMTVRAVDRTGQAVRGNVRANYYRPLQIDESARTVDNWFGLPADRNNIFCAAGVDDGRCAYGQPADGQFGTGGINTENGPDFFNLDFMVGKQFPITEKRYIDFRAEFFNLLNTVSWAPPGLNINNPNTFGQIGAQVQEPRRIQFGLKLYF
jgi:hypothetical protein